MDRLCHNSLVTGATLSKAKIIRHKHNDYKDAERQLKKTSYSGKLYVIMESVYSMDGDIGDLPAARNFSDKYGGFLIIDEAHGLGTIGKTGRGIEEHYDYKYKADLICGSLTKSIGSQGGYICCTEGLRTQFTFKANGSIFSAPISAFNTGAGIKALEIMEREPERVQRLQKTAEYMREQFRKHGFNIGDACTCVVPVIFNDIYKTLHMHKWLL